MFMTVYVIPIQHAHLQLHLLEIGETLHGGLHKAVHILLEGGGPSFLSMIRTGVGLNHAGCSWYILMYNMKQYDII